MRVHSMARTADRREGNGHGLPLTLIVGDRELGGAVRQNCVSGDFESLKFNLEILFCFVLIVISVNTTDI